MAKGDADKVKSNLKAALRKIENNVEKALTRGAVVITQESAKEVPIDKGVLNQSRYVTKEGSGFNTTVKVGYSDPKAIYVHEDLTKAHGEFFNATHARDIAAGREHPRRPGEKAKFLEDPVKNNLDKIQDEVRRAMAS